MAPDSSTTLHSSIQPHPSLICSCTMPPPLVVNDAVDTTAHHLATSTPSPLLELLGAHHPQHLSPEQQFLPRRRLHGGYDAQDAAAAQSSLNFGLSSSRGSGVDRRDLGFTSREGNDVK
ncbi:hypothetical protein VPH35_126704 [Triticum aestivum]